jgi:hypothetical protein
MLHGISDPTSLVKILIHIVPSRIIKRNWLICRKKSTGTKCSNIKKTGRISYARSCGMAAQNENNSDDAATTPADRSRSLPQQPAKRRNRSEISSRGYAYTSCRGNPGSNLNSLARYWPEDVVTCQHRNTRTHRPRTESVPKPETVGGHERISSIAPISALS